jgi:hypothetical protein
MLETTEQRAKWFSRKTREAEGNYDKKRNRDSDK